MSIRDIFLAITIALVWGMNFTITKIGLGHFPPLMLMGIRFLLVALILMPFVKKPAISFKHLYLMSLVYGVGYHALVFSGLWQGVSVSVGIIAVQLQVPFTALLGTIFLRDHLGWRRLLGMIIAFAGIVIIVGSPNVLENAFGFMLIVISAFLWASYNIQIKKWGTSEIMGSIAWLSAFSAPQLLFLSYLFESHQWTLLATTTWPAAFSLIYMVLLTTIVGLGLWSYLMHRYSVHQVTPFSMLAPVFAILSAIILLHEKLNAHIIIGGLVTIMGVAIIVLRKPDIIAENILID